MIVGLRFRLTSAELKQHLLARVEYHSTRAKEKDASLPKMRAQIEDFKKTAPATHISHANKGGYAGRDPDDILSDMATQVRDHQNSALAFAYMAEHLFDEDYDLDEAALLRLEILRR